jgi:hypothetical protein
MGRRWRPLARAEAPLRATPPARRLDGAVLAGVEACASVVLAKQLARQQ